LVLYIVGIGIEESTTITKRQFQTVGDNITVLMTEISDEDEFKWIKKLKIVLEVGNRVEKRKKAYR